MADALEADSEIQRIDTVREADEFSQRKSRVNLNVDKSISNSEKDLVATQGMRPNESLKSLISERAGDNFFPKDSASQKQLDAWP